YIQMINYDAINAKINGMFGRLLKSADYALLSRMPSVDEVGRALQSRPAYSRALDPGLTMRRGSIERRLMLSLCADYDRLYSFAGDARLRKFLDGYFLRYEAHELKMLLCMAYDGRDLSEYFESDIYKRMGIDPGKLRAARDVADLIERLNGSEFYPVLSRVYNENSSLFELESQLDLYCHRRFSECIERYLDKSDSKQMRFIARAETDLRNIEWIYRLKTRYKVDGDLIYAHLMPSVSRLTKEHLKELINAGTEQFFELLRGGPYSKELKDAADANLEAVCHREIRRVYAVTRRKHPHSPAPVIAYIYFKDREIQNITSLLEGVRYKLAPEEIVKFAEVSYD
ncbi:MAG: V-type ATPase subunit, partial [Defluviitaleaceae bacterium]|nr:V-type ATPase subunit [Defluviitaleaceae bacterium]